MNEVPLVIKEVVYNDLCIGCGICVAQCPSHAMEMDWDEHGFLLPILTGNCKSEGECLQVCPFNPKPLDSVRTEDEIANIFLNHTEKYSEKIGKYIGLYAGYSNQYRLLSSSGGLGTYISSELLIRGIVQHVISVRESNCPGKHYEYRILSLLEDVEMASKTKYYPVTLGEVFSKIKDLEGNVAVVGVACFVKAIRLAQTRDLILNAKINFVIGIICGGIKSRFYTEFLAGNLGVERSDIARPLFRVKDLSSSAIDYSFSCIDADFNQRKEVKMKSLGDMWGTGLFKANGCEFCDDVATELADVSLGDAWVEPYINDGAGTNVIVSRSVIADKIIREGFDRGDLQVTEINEEMFVYTQRGSYNHRHLGLGYRIARAKRQKKTIPPKRRGNHKISFFFKLVQYQRMRLRKLSIVNYAKMGNSEDFSVFIEKNRFWLGWLTRIYHYYNKVISYFDRGHRDTNKFGT
jgi:coenzyme F420-reducing hydrogenase beta subunit